MPLNEWGEVESSSVDEFGNIYYKRASEHGNIIVTPTYTMSLGESIGFLDVVQERAVARFIRSVLGIVEDLRMPFFRLYLQEMMSARDGDDYRRFNEVGDFVFGRVDEWGRLIQSMVDSVGNIAYDMRFGRVSLNVATTKTDHASATDSHWLSRDILLAEVIDFYDKAKSAILKNLVDNSVAFDKKNVNLSRKQPQESMSLLDLAATYTRVLDLVESMILGEHLSRNFVGTRALIESFIPQEIISRIVPPLALSDSLSLTEANFKVLRMLYFTEALILVESMAKAFEGLRAFVNALTPTQVISREVPPLEFAEAMTLAETVVAWRDIILTEAVAMTDIFRRQVTAMHSYVEGVVHGERGRGIRLRRFSKEWRLLAERLYKMVVLRVVTAVGVLDKVVKGVAKQFEYGVVIADDRQPHDIEKPLTDANTIDDSFSRHVEAWRLFRPRVRLREAFAKHFEGERVFVTATSFVETLKIRFGKTMQAACLYPRSQMPNIGVGKALERMAHLISPNTFNKWRRR